MVKHTGTLHVVKSIAEEMERLCRQHSTEYFEYNGIEFDEEFEFPDGMRMAIQVCSSEQPNEPCWSQGVLFAPDGVEEDFTEVKDYFFGKYQVEHNNSIYEVEVKSI